MKNPNIPQDWKKEVELYIPKDAREESEKREILTLMEREGDRLLLRECSYAHMTASSVIVNRDRTKMLMAFHKIYQSWAWTGGHADGDGDFEAVARREAQETQKSDFHTAVRERIGPYNEMGQYVRICRRIFTNCGCLPRPLSQLR